MGQADIALIAHLMRRAGFGASRDELDAYAAEGYEATVGKLLGEDEPETMPEDLIRRYHPEQVGLMGEDNAGAYWLYRMITSTSPLQEKMALFWHNVFATGYAKVSQGRVLMEQIRMFRRHGLGSFDNLLVELSKDPAMIIWLDNHENHRGAINENYGRELLELFSMGVGNYSEQDVKDCSRAFTGWTIANAKYMDLRARRDSVWPYGRLSTIFEFRPNDHDDGEKTFLGESGRLGGEEVIEIICRQEATAQFISRHMYHFFVADEPPVPQWPYTPPRDPEAIDTLSRAYIDSQYDIRSMLHVLFNSEFFKSEECRFEKIKSPADLVAGVLRLTEEFGRPSRAILSKANRMTFMGQTLTAPPSVEGWHQGLEWVNTGSLVERVNFAAEAVGSRDAAGVRAMVERIRAACGEVISPEALVDACLDAMGAITVSDDTRSTLVGFVSRTEEVAGDGAPPDDNSDQKVGRMLQMVAATAEFQRE